MRKRLLAIFLTLAMALSLLPTTAFAEEATCTVVHEYYTNGKLDGRTPESITGKQVGDTINDNDIQKQNVYDGNTYTYTDIYTYPSLPYILTSGDNTITLQYDRYMSTVTWLDEDGITVLYGPIYYQPGEEDVPTTTVVPQKDEDADYIYSFEGWEMSLDEDLSITYRATYSPIPKVTITIKFVDEDGKQVGDAVTVKVAKGGDYDVTDEVEAIPEGYKANGDPEGDLTGTADSDKTITVPVKKMPEPDPGLGILTITNTISSDSPSGAASKTFTFTVTGPNNYSRTVTITGSGSQTITGLAPGQYSVAKVDTSDLLINGYDLVTNIRNASPTVEAGGTASVEAVNRYVPSAGHTTDTPSTPSTPTVTPSTPSKPADPPKTPEIKPSPIQGDVIRTDREEIPDWIDRLEMPDYARTFYDVMAGNTLGSHTVGGKKQSIFEVEQNFALPASIGGTAQVEQIEVVEFDLMDMYADEDSKIQSTIFENENFYHIPADNGDKAVDYAKLEMGSVVKTSAFNGVFVTKIPYDNTFDTKKKEVCEYIAAVYQAFDRDHPEIFWLSGKCKARITVVAAPKTGAKEAYCFLVLADKDGFTMCAPDWVEAGAITAGIARRDAAVEAILQTVTADGTADKIKQINKYLTEHNQYNTTPDLTTIGNEPHECLAALLGQIGTDGPVCDGYSRAFKVLCDKLSIPCVLETGWAKATASGTPGFHMWNLVQVGGTWYGADITWDDPSVKGIVAAKSGRENENFLLTGSDTVFNSLAFNQSHVVQNQAATGGVDFNNGPILSPIAYSGLSASVFDDVPNTAYYYDGVLWAVDRGITAGTSATTFSPDATCTQVQILTFLWRSAGKPTAAVQLPFTLNKGMEYAKDALCWAYQNGMIGAGFDQNAPCTRADAVKFLWQAEGSPAASGSVFTDVPAGAGYAQAVAWAVAKGVTSGTSATTFSPDKVCSRAQIVTFLCRDRA